MTTSADRPPSGRVDFGRALGFVFEDPEWLKKILLGGLFTLLSMVVVGTLLVAGYWVRLLRRAARGEARPLPEWSDWGGLFADGIAAFGIYLVHVLLLVLPLGAGGCLFGLVAALLDKKGGGDAVGVLAGAGILALSALVFVVALLLAVYVPAVLTRFAVLGRFGVTFELRENLGFIRRNPGEYLLALAIFLVAHFISQFGVLLLCVGVFPATFWSYCVLAYPLAQIARRDPLLGPAATSS